MEIGNVLHVTVSLIKHWEKLEISVGFSAGREKNDENLDGANCEPGPKRKISDIMKIRILKPNTIQKMPRPKKMNCVTKNEIDSSALPWNSS